MLFLLKRPARPQFRGHLRCDCSFMFCCASIGGEGLELFDPGSVAFPFGVFDFCVELLQQFNLRPTVKRHSIACKPLNRSDETAFNESPPETYRAKLLDAPLAIDHDAPSTLICKTSGSRSMFVMGILRTRGSLAELIDGKFENPRLVEPFCYVARDDADLPPAHDRPAETSLRSIACTGTRSRRPTLIVGMSPRWAAA
jgi:hypothetical protein